MTIRTKEAVAAGQTDQVLGSTGARGDWLEFLLVVPASTSPGAVTIKDGTDSAITVFVGGASSVSGLTPFAIPVACISETGAWRVSTGANVSVLAVGEFS